MLLYNFINNTSDMGKSIQTCLVEIFVAIALSVFLENILLTHHFDKVFFVDIPSKSCWKLFCSIFCL